MDVINSLFLENHGDAASSAMADDAVPVKRRRSKQKPLAGAYLALLLFVVVYFARPEDLIPGLSNVPLAKIAAALAVVAFVLSLRHVRWPLPREVVYLILLVGQFLISASMSPIWRVGAFQRTLEFGKVMIVVLVMASAVITSERFHRLIFVQAASVALIAAISVSKGHLLSKRLAGLLSGNYSNPNDLALAIVISLPLCLALLLISRGTFSKVAWASAMVIMTYAVFLTGSRGGFVALIVSVTLCLWEFAVRRRHRYLVVLTAVLAILLLLFSPKMLTNRLRATFSSKADVTAYDSAQQREQLLRRSVEITAKHPLFGVGPGNFEILSGSWHVSHNTFTELSSEGGLPALALFLLILSRGFRNVRKIKRSSRGQRSLGVFAGGLYASLAGYGTGAIFSSTGYQFFPYLLVAYTTALQLIAKELSKKERGAVNRVPTQLCAYEAEPCAG
jgi:O-antigen ligase